MPQFGRNVVEFNNPSTQVKTATPSDHVLAYIGETNTPVYIPVSDLQNAILKEPINESVVAQGINGNTTAKLDYGVNVITSASATNFAIRLPFPPIKGRTVTIINKSGYPLTVHPSVVGGSINGVINGTATVPSNRNAYTFTCWENPLPGAWSWSPPATTQWSSGLIEETNRTSSGSLTFIDNSRKSYSNMTSQTASSDNGITPPPNLINNGAWYLVPSPMWNKITKIKCYTNQLQLISNALEFTVASSFTEIVTELGTTNIVNKTFGGVGIPLGGNYGFCNTRVPGSFVAPTIGNFSTYLSANVGDPGTYYGEITIGNYNIINIWNQIGVDFLPNQLRTVFVNPDYYDVYRVHAISPLVNNRLPIGTNGFKCEFFIEYN